MIKRAGLYRVAIAVLIIVITAVWASAQSRETTENIDFKITEPPAELKIPSFYSKFISVGGYPIVASSNVNDYAVKEAAYIVSKMLEHRADVKKAMIESGSRLCIIAHNEFTTDLPEFAFLGRQRMRNYPGISGKDYWDARARGTGGSQSDPYCSCGEENLLNYPGDPYSTECILIHEFAHNIYLRGLIRIDPTFDKRLKEAYESAIKKGLWKGTYAAVNHNEYFAEGAQSWYDCNRENDDVHNHVNTRAELKEYDPALAQLCKEVFGDTDWRYTKAITRLTNHLAGYDPSKAPRFVWPERLERVRREIRNIDRERSRRALLQNEYELREILCWNVYINKQLLTNDAGLTEKAVELLKEMLEEIVCVVPETAVIELKKVPLILSPEYPGTPPRAEYHPDVNWLRDHNRNPAMAKAVELTNIRIFEQEKRRMPNFVLHELAHAYHDRVLGFDNKEIKAAYDKAKTEGKYENVQRRDARGRVTSGRAYAMTDHKEYFAETTEAFFSKNDIYPFSREELAEHDPYMFNLLKKLWGVEK